MAVVNSPKVTKPEEKPVIKEEPSAPRNTVQIDRIRRNTKLLRLNNLYVLPYANLVKIPRLHYVKIQPEEEPVAAVPPPVTRTAPPAITTPPKKTVTEPPAKPGATPVADKKEERRTICGFLVKQDEAKRNHSPDLFYQWTGQVLPDRASASYLKDSKTQKEVKSVYRNISGGEPEPIKIPEEYLRCADTGQQGQGIQCCYRRQ